MTKSKFLRHAGGNNSIHGSRVAGFFTAVDFATGLALAGDPLKVSKKKASDFVMATWPADDADVPYEIVLRKNSDGRDEAVFQNAAPVAAAPAETEETTEDESIPPAADQPESEEDDVEEPISTEDTGDSVVGDETEEYAEAA